MVQVTVALAGNPNVGKSTVFNALTGADQHVGNYPGKTVQKRSGTLRAINAAAPQRGVLTQDAQVVTVVDLPGTYSLSPYSSEEEIARDFIVDEQPELVANVVDAVNLERNLYLTTQILETGAPVVVCLNMLDQAESQDITIDVARLSMLLSNTPVMPLIARRGEGLEDLQAFVQARCFDRTALGAAAASQAALVDYGPDVECEIEKLAAIIAAIPLLGAAYQPRWLAIQLLEGDETLLATISREPAAAAVIKTLEDANARLRQCYGEDVNVALVNARYEFVHRVVNEAVTHRGARRVTMSDKVDRVVTHPLLGIPIFLFAMWVVFKLTIDVSAPFMGWIEGVIAGPVTNWVIVILNAVGLGGSWVEGLIVDGVLAGVGGVLVFVPIMLVLYLALAVLEDSGYMARGALVMDRLMRKFGLHGKSFVPLIVGFGCSVPAIYATRTLDNRRDRILTGLLVPFMSCSARLPVYVLFAAIFFPFAASLAIFAMYLLGIVVAVLVGLILNHTVLKGDGQSYLLIELPPYRLPVARNIWRQMWERTSSFVHNAWTTILIVSIVLWLLLAIPMPGGEGSFANVPVEESVFGTTAGALAPLLTPLGFGSWEAAGSLMTGFVAKEVIVATMAQIYHVAPVETESAPPPTLLEDAAFIVTSFAQAALDTVRTIPQIFGINLISSGPTEEPSELMVAVRSGFDASSNGHGALAGLAFMVFVLLYTPCVMAITAERHELGTRWMWVSIVGQLAIAWLGAFVVFQVGMVFLR